MSLIEANRGDGWERRLLAGTVARNAAKRTAPVISILALTFPLVTCKTLTYFLYSD